MSDNEHEQSKWEALAQLRRVCKRWNLRAGIDFSTPLNVLSLRSCQSHHMRQWGVIFQILPASDLLLGPCHQLRRSTTPQGITHIVPKRIKTIDHNSQAIGQCKSKWLPVSPLNLHMQHQSIMISCLFLRLSIVRILPNAAVQTKKATLEGAFAFHTHFQGKLPWGWGWTRMLFFGVIKPMMLPWRAGSVQPSCASPARLL